MRASNQSLKDYLVYLKSIENEKDIRFALNTQNLERDVNLGLYFNSTIPQGYGAGSSGALVAALFHHYLLTPAPDQNLHEPGGITDQVRRQMSVMESYFHGSSSGLDPLTSWLGKPFSIDANKEIHFLSMPLFPDESKIKVFLIDTQVTGNTKPLVDWYKNQVELKQLDATMLHDLSNETQMALLDKEFTLFDKKLLQLSAFQFKNLHPMIPENIKKTWDAGLQSQIFTLKLCGSGGGGFVLGFTKDSQKCQKMISEMGFDVIFL
jgi:mevalonate kinase